MLYAIKFSTDTLPNHVQVSGTLWDDVLDPQAGRRIVGIGAREVFKDIGKRIGVAVLLPFLLIDLIVANVLAALGLPGLSAATVAVPLKLLLFVAIEGWSLLVRGLIAGYV